MENEKKQHAEEKRKRNIELNKALEENEKNRKNLKLIQDKQREEEKQKYTSLINKYDKTLSWVESENEELKRKIKELEAKLPNNKK